LQYNWQAEFRSKYVWNHPALLIGSTIEDNKNEDENNEKTKAKTKTKTKKNKYKYKYMMWIDSDAYCTVPWKNDPIQFMIENDGVIMFDNILHETIPEHLGYKNIVPKTYDYYDNQIVCNMTLNKEKGCIERQLYKQKPILRTNLKKKKKKKKKKKNGSNNKQELIVPPVCPKNDNNDFRNIEVIHGFFHITNLDFYRKHLSKFVKLMNYNQNQNNNGCNFMCRSPCDQLAVTLPAVYYAPHKTYDMISNGFHLNIFHNFMIDGKISTNSKLYGGGDTDTKIFPNFWNNYAKYNLTSAANGVCPTSHWG
jgi:hypothetical protein